MGAYTSVPTWWQHSESRYRLICGTCPECGTVNFPPNGACVGCQERVEYDTFEPNGTGTVRTVTVIRGGAPPEFTSLLAKEDAIAVAVIELDEGVRVPAMLTDCEPDDIERGDRVTRVIRRIYEQEGVIRYGYKFRPVREEDETRSSPT